MAKYLGEEKLDSLVDTPYHNYSKAKWALYFVMLGQYDGSHHKQWALDQIARVLNNTPVEVYKATWDDGTVEYRPQTAENTSKEYKSWVQDMLGEYDEENDEYEYSYDTGCCP